MHAYVPWDFRITIDLFLGGLGIGVFLLSVLFHLYNKDYYAKLIKWTAYLSPILIGGGLLFLISELGRPERFLTTLYRFNPQSVTSWGGLVQGIFVIVSLIYAYMIFKNNTNKPSFRLIYVVGSVFAIGVGVYHGMLLTSLGRPLWVGGLVTALFLISSLLGGMAIVFILKSMSIPLPAATEVRSQVAITNTSEDEKKIDLNLFTFLLIGLQIILLFVWQVSMYRSGAESVESMQQMMSNYGAMWWGIAVFVGLVIPFILSVFQLVKKGTTELPNGLALLFSIFVLIGSVTFKHIIIMAGQYNIPFFL